MYMPSLLVHLLQLLGVHNPAPAAPKQTHQPFPIEVDLVVAGQPNLVVVAVLAVLADACPVAADHCTHCFHLAVFSDVLAGLGKVRCDAHCVCSGNTVCSRGSLHQSPALLQSLAAVLPVPLSVG